jgi:hypothetical protein
MPKSAMSPIAGTTADGALPKAAMPLGKVNTPAPTMLLTKLKTSLGMVAVPVPAPAPAALSSSSEAALVAMDALNETELGKQIPIQVCLGVIVVHSLFREWTRWFKEVNDPGVSETTVR